jgi:hypothetical protein
MIFIANPPPTLYHTAQNKKSFDASVLRGRAAEGMMSMGFGRFLCDRIQLRHIAKKVDKLYYAFKRSVDAM